MNFEILKQVGIALAEQQTFNIMVAGCLIETAKLLPANETRLPLTDALQALANKVGEHNATIATLREMVEAEVRNDY